MLYAVFALFLQSPSPQQFGSGERPIIADTLIHDLYYCKYQNGTFCKPKRGSFSTDTGTNAQASIHDKSKALLQDSVIPVYPNASFSWSARPLITILMPYDAHASNDTFK